MLNIDILKNVYYKVWYDLISNLERKPDKYNSENIWWYNNHHWFMYQSKKKDILVVNHCLVWSIVTKHFDLDQQQTQIFIKNQMEDQFKLGYLIPCSNWSSLKNRWKNNSN